MRRYFAFFVASGFCGLVYETVWLRLYMAQFGVTAAALAIVVSCFMAGLALGSWLVGILGKRFSGVSLRTALRLYAGAEAAIGLAGLWVPASFRVGGRAVGAWAAGDGFLLTYVITGAWTAATLLPACTAMGTTLPLGMLALRKEDEGQARTSFSFLYLANVLGAVAGTLLSAFVLIELVGFSHTVYLAAAINLSVAALAFFYSSTVPARPAAAPAAQTTAGPTGQVHSGMLWLLFLTGFASMAMEVVWVRQFTAYLGTVVYAFAAILACYLLATTLGSRLYRRHAAAGGGETGIGGAGIWALVALCGLLPQLAADHRILPVTSMTADGSEMGRISLATLLRVCLGVAPVSGLFGYLTPRLVDRWSSGSHDRAGLAYGVNTVGCIAGPLVAGFWLLPQLGERHALAVLALPFLAVALVVLLDSRRRLAQGVALAAAASACALLLAGTQGFDDQFPRAQVQRDHTATTIATGDGMRKRLLVNGVGITVLTPSTKAMAHLPLALLGRPAARALIICFGMGTTFRSVRSWGIPATAVELVPGVPRLFSYFFPDGPALLASKDVHLVIDDGRRFLETTRETYDLITLDPPPPVEAASSSLLYSKEFYSLVRRRLAPGGILQQWYQGGELVVFAAFARALTESFPFVVAYRSFGGFGVHFFASDAPITVPAPSELASRLPPAAAADFLEWGPRKTVADQFTALLAHPVPLQKLFEAMPEVSALEDDWPVNEYYFLRRLGRAPETF